MGMYRKPVNKQRSAKKFRRDLRTTKAPNIRAVARGGFRL